MESYFLDVSGIEGTDLFCDSDAASLIRKEVADLPLKAVHHFGNGNYHYISLFFLERITQPFHLILFDHHSDCQESAFGESLLSCGNWVKQAVQSLDKLKSVQWIGGPDCTGSLKEPCSQSAALPVYISIDLDILSPECIETVWDQGDMTIGEMKRILGSIFNSYKVLGVDVCGYKDIGHPTVKSLESFLCERL